MYKEQTRKTLAVHLHLYYSDQLPDILCYLKSLENMDYDLFVTLVQQDKKTVKMLKEVVPHAHIRVVPNCGYDIGPFIDFLHHINLEQYEYIMKIHTKGTKSPNHTLLNGRCLNNVLWKEILYNSLMKNKKRVIDNLKLMNNNEQIGMISSAYCTTNNSKCYDFILPDINAALHRMGFKPVQKLTFVAGSMFMVRAFLLKPLLCFSQNDFSETDGRLKSGTFAHVMERVFGAVIECQGYRVKGITHDNYTRKFIQCKIKHFLFQKKHTVSNHIIIKICRIPVWHRKTKS